MWGDEEEQELSSCWDGRPFGYNRHGSKSGGDAVPLSMGELGPHLTQRGLSRGLPPSVPSFILIRPAVWPQRYRQADRQTGQDRTGQTTVR